MSARTTSGLFTGYVWAVVLAVRWAQLQLLEPVVSWYVHGNPSCVLT